MGLSWKHHAAFVTLAVSLAPAPGATAREDCGRPRRQVLYRDRVVVGPNRTGETEGTFPTTVGGHGVRYLLVIKGHPIGSHARPFDTALRPSRDHWRYFETLTVTLNGAVVPTAGRNCSRDPLEVTLNPVGGGPNTIVVAATGTPGAVARVWVLAVPSRDGDPTPACNRPPVADAGPDQTLPLGAIAALDGSGSTDADGDVLSFRWSLESVPPGSLAILSDPTAVDPTLPIDVAGTYRVELVVDDGAVSSAPDTVEITTDNSPPVADAGPDRTVRVGETATLDGSGSTDVDGDPLTFSWSILSRPPGSTAALSDPAAVLPTLVADAPGAYEVRLVVSDGLVASSPDTVVVSTENSPPVADAGPDQSVLVGATVILDGSGSTDVDGDPLTYAWSLTTVPTGSLAVLGDPTAVMPSFLADERGTYVAQLVVDDGTVESTPDTVTVSTENSAPVADAGPDQTVVAGQVVTLDGTGSSDADGDALSFRWSIAARPAGSTAVLSDPANPTPTFTADRPGTYLVQLVVSDGALDSAPDTATIDTTNSAPVADAGPDQADVPPGSVVTLDGSASSDADGHPLTYSWSLLSRPPGSLAALVGDTSIAPELTPDLVGDYVAQLVVNDGFVDSAPDTVRVTTAGGPAPVVTIVATDATASEAGDTGAFTVSRTGSLAQPLTVACVASGTATGAVDYVALPATLTIPSGASAIAIAVVPIDDDEFEGDEGVQLQLTAGADYLVGTPGAAVVTIEDDDTLVSVVATDPVAAENGPDPATFSVSRLGPSAGPLTVFYTVSGTADAGVDYVALPGSVTIESGAAEAVLMLEPTDDALLEGPESVVLTLGAGPGYTVSALDTATATIQDDERPAVSIVVTDGAASEAGPDAGSFTVSRTGPTTAALEVFYDVAGAATEGVDYVGLAGSVTIPVGASGATVAITPIDDSLVEGAENVILTLAPDPAYVVATPGIAALAIADDDLSAITIEATDPDASEAGPTSGSFTLRRTGDTAAPLTVFLGAGGSAVSADYEPISLIMVFAPGEGAATITLTPRADILVEGPEELTLTIAPRPEYVVGTPSAATVTIADDPTVVTLSASDPGASEAGLDPGAFVLTRAGGSTADALTVFVSIGGSAIANRDYVVLSGNATIPAGEMAVLVPVSPLPDNLVEGDETVVLSLSPGSGATYLVGSPSTASVTIADDPPVVSLTPTDPDAAEAGLDPGTIAFTRSGGDLTAPLNVLYTKGGTATNGLDYRSLGGATSLLVIPGGQAAATVTIEPLADNLVEGPEVAILTLAPSAGYQSGASPTAEVTIADDPPVAGVTATDPDAAEAGPDPGTFTFARSGGNLAASLTVNFTRGGTATNVVDYVTIPSQVTFPAGQATAALTITPIDDPDVEGSETVTLTLTGSGSVVVGVPATATVTIADND